MEKTTNYGLNQWQKQDRIMMSDFNADNQKLDAALAGLSSRMTWETVRDIVTEEAANQIDLDISDVDLTAYACVILSVYNNTKNASFFVSVGKLEDANSYAACKSTGGATLDKYITVLQSSYAQIALLLTGGPADRYLQAFTMYGLDFMGGASSLKCSQINELTLDGGQSTAAAGLHIKLIGVKRA